jgi:DTW domain-containing protein YfiP
MALRKHELAKTRKPYMARGSKVKRCEHCLLPLTGCLCTQKPEALPGSAFCFVMYWGEAFKPSNTGRLVADVMHDNHAFLWDRTQPDPALLSLLQDPRYEPVLVFPHQYAMPERCVDTVAALPGIRAGKTPLYVMLDGTWREAKKMFKSPCFNTLPVLGVIPLSASRYQLREAAHKHQLCTAEVAIMILELGGEAYAAGLLAQYFELFRRQYIAGKPHMRLLEDEAPQTASSAAS